MPTAESQAARSVIVTPGDHRESASRLSATVKLAPKEEAKPRRVRARVPSDSAMPPEAAAASPYVVSPRRFEKMSANNALTPAEKAYLRMKHVKPPTRTKACSWLTGLVVTIRRTWMSHSHCKTNTSTRVRFACDYFPLIDADDALAHFSLFLFSEHAGNLGYVTNAP